VASKIIFRKYICVPLKKYTKYTKEKQVKITDETTEKAANILLVN